MLKADEARQKIYPITHADEILKYEKYEKELDDAINNAIKEAHYNVVITIPEEDAKYIADELEYHGYEITNVQQKVNMCSGKQDYLIRFSFEHSLN